MSVLTDSVADGTLRDVVVAFLDVAIVAYLVYRILLVLKDTRAFQVLIGLLLIALIYIFSTFFQLYTLNWILKQFLSPLILIIIILFQDDIRRGLARVGKNPFFRRVQDAEYLGELVTTASSLARKKIGALIVVEREAKLKAWLESGIEVDAKITKEVLTSMFLPTSPVHDGAVVIRHGRVLAAGVILPLTQYQRISKTLGTRHRAALGISEVTDAIVIVVSEEDGSISLVTAGNMQRALEGSELRKAISAAFQLDVEQEVAKERAPAPAPTPLGEATKEVQDKLVEEARESGL